MVKSAENHSGPKNTNISIRNQRSQGFLPKKWEQQKMNITNNKNNERFRYTKTQSANKPVQGFTIKSTVTTTHTSKLNVSKDPSRKNVRTDTVSTKKVTNLSVNGICGPLSSIFPSGSMSQGLDMKVTQKSNEICSSNISCSKSKSKSVTQQSSVNITSNTKNNLQNTPKRPPAITPPPNNICTRCKGTKKKNGTIRLINDKIVYSLDKYEQLKDSITKAIQSKKVFSIYGRCRAIREALRARGWVEKLKYRAYDNLKREIPYGNNDPKLDIKKKQVITNSLLLSCNPNFLWTASTNDYLFPKNSNPYTNPFINRIRMDDKHFTTKAGLCSALKFQHWYHIHGVSDVNTPRSYNMAHELEEFQVDYRITSCTNLLKWFIKNRNKEESVFSKNGKIPFSVVFFALKRCQAFIQRKQHRDIDKVIKDPSDSEWDNYVDSYYKLIFKKQQLKTEHRNVMDFYVVAANEMIKHMRKYNPELDCEGMNNIWIIKPGALSRGRGIALSNDYKTLCSKGGQPTVQNYVVQKYIEKPLLVYGTKFDIRQYYIITNTHPLVIWMYKNCYLRFSSQTYSLANFHESIHLTNNAIQHKYKSNRNRDANLPANNMWNLQQFKDYLAEEGHETVWNKIIYQGMKKNIIGAMLNCQDGMINRMNQFELYGCDFIIDRQFKPWLIEINSSPDMSSSTKITAKLCPEVLEDIIKVVIDHKNNKQASTGEFECVYKQRMTQPICSINNDMSSSLIVSGVEEHMRNCKSRNRSKGSLIPQYKEACSDKDLRVKLPWKHQLIKMGSEEDILKQDILNIKYNEATSDSTVTKDEELKNYPSPSSSSKEVQSNQKSDSMIVIKQNNSEEDYIEDTMQDNSEISLTKYKLVGETDDLDKVTKTSVFQLVTDTQFHGKSNDSIASLKNTAIGKKINKSFYITGNRTHNTKKLSHKSKILPLEKNLIAADPQKERSLKKDSLFLNKQNLEKSSQDNEIVPREKVNFNNELNTTTKETASDIKIYQTDSNIDKLTATLVKPLDFGDTQLPIVEVRSEVVSNIQHAIDDQIDNLNELLLVRKALSDHWIENSNESFDNKRTQLLPIEEELLCVGNSPLAIEDNHNQNAEKLTIIKNKNQVNSRLCLVHNRFNNGKYVETKQSLSEHVSKQIQKQLHESLNVKKIVKMFMKQRKGLMDSLLQFYQDDSNHRSNQQKPSFTHKKS